MSDCVFCKMVAGEVPCYKIWEDDKHLAFLTLWPNTEGFSVVITKDHQDSYFAKVKPEVRQGIIEAAATVAELLDHAFDDVGRTGLMFEGFGVDHLHAKLFPMHGTSDETWQKRSSNHKVFYDLYPGYISSHDADEMPDNQLKAIAQKIQGIQKV